jgi:DNA polymerase I-like protein with 3'-5' exonuclease and polymerase domains
MSLPRSKELFKLIKSSDDWPAASRYYYINKKLCHQSNYGGSARRFALSVVTESEGMVKITQKEASRLLEFYHSLFPEIRMWHRDIEQEYAMHHILYNLFGYSWKIDKPLTDELKRKLYAFKPQSTVGVITHRAIVAMQDYIEANNKAWDMLNNCHDSMLWQVPEDKEEIKESIIVSEKFMNQELISPRGEKFNMKSEVAVGYNWGHYKDNNLRGLGCLPVEAYLN